MKRSMLAIPNSEYDPCLKTGRFEDLFPENAVAFRVLKRWEQVTILEWWGECDAAQGGTGGIAT